MKRYGKTLSVTAMVALVLALVLAAVSGTALAAPASQQGGYLPTNSITVSGSGQATGTPDVAYVNLGVDTVNASISEAVAQANATMQALIAALQEVGVAAEDIQTISYNVYPEDRFDPQTGSSTGERVYRVNNMLTVTVRDIAKVSDVMQAGLNAGATSINGLSFGIDDTSALEQDARVKAIEDARQRAQNLADALGVTLGAPIIVNEALGGGGYPMYDMAQAVGMGGAGPQITPGQLNVNVSVTVTFAIGE